MMALTTTADERAPASAVPDSEGDRLAPVWVWLFVLTALVIAMVAVGGATRLTGSGLSITEWRPVTGTVPPLSAQAWQAEFDKYRASPQYDLVNRGMSLDEFKFIYCWEWAHRLLGRIVGALFFLPFAWFWVTGRVRGGLAAALLGVGVLGGLQGAIGWIMVASGLEPGMTAVAPLKLTLHLVTASIILAALLWLALGLGAPRSAAPAGQRGALALLVLVLTQIALGGLVAGSKAGFSYNTWPLMDGRLVPPAEALFVRTPWIENLVDNVALVQFDHRLAAYVLLAAALAHALHLRRAARGTSAARRAIAVAGLISAQVVLGIVTLVLVVPLWAGLAHQLLAMLVLAMATAHARLCRGVAG
jgi:cytochrome c oxidase assembly protein subunit 15